VGRIPIAVHKASKFTAFIRIKVAYITNVALGRIISVLSLLSFFGGGLRVNFWEIKETIIVGVCILHRDHSTTE
jgi:hypothetical protein